MRKLGLVFGFLTLGGTGLYAGTCSSTMTLAALSGASLPGGCDFNGFNFNNFSVGNYLATSNFSGAAQYNPLSSPGNLANYVATFAATSGGGVSVFFTGSAAQSDGQPAWTIQTTGSTNSSANFSFEIKYNIANGTNANPANNKNVISLQTLDATLGNVTYTGPTSPGSDASTTFSKVSQANGGLQSVTDKLTLTSGTQVKTLNLTPGNNTGVIPVTDNLSLQISNTQNATLTTGTLGNSFNINAVPEPVTISFVGMGLVGLALLKRRARG